VETEKAPKGLNEDIIRFISQKKNEPEWMLEWRLDAYRKWLEMEEPKWAKVEYPPIDFQDLRPGRRRSRALTRWIRRSSRPTRSWASR